ncbi:Methyltransferase-like protein 4 [Apophysomyces sp. BC1034]|nr:Methyltransferase-like protein 4 [Apophysomyces sp. BC1015]KAG0180180.1 Methyltransferase-like protein 4 [Apophysomyces sp. BC1021]KAG0190696.1 Methyltransferase-like protein 4 [Apophysomyces sp. BC1034]
MVHIVDSQRALSYPGWSLRQGEFAVQNPYFRKHDSQPRQKKQKQEPSRTDVQTNEHHSTIASWLSHCIEEAQTAWPSIEKAEENNSKDDPPNIDFISLLKLTERFMTPIQGIIEVDQDCMVMDTLDLLNIVITNPANSCRRIQLPDDTRYLVPPQASFLMGDMHTSMDPLVDFGKQWNEELDILLIILTSGKTAQSKGGFDCVVLDPPWPNKSVHRSSHYETQDIYDLFTIPLPSLLRPGQCSLVAVWVTNKPKYRRFIQEKLFKAWGVTWAADWYWVKMTTAGELVMPLDSPHRKPYEQIVVGHTCDQDHDIGSQSIFSTPCKRHSRKPPLQDILSPYLRSDPQCLEMFARCLIPSWTSWGNECIKFQHEQYFAREEAVVDAETLLTKEVASENEMNGKELLGSKCT